MISFSSTNNDKIAASNDHWRHRCTVIAADPAKTAATYPGAGSGLHCHPALAQRFSRLTSVAHDIWSAPAMAWFPPTPGRGVYYRNHTPHASGFLVALKDND